METKENIFEGNQKFWKEIKKLFLERTKRNIFEGNEKTNFRRKPKYKFMEGN